MIFNLTRRLALAAALATAAALVVAAPAHAAGTTLKVQQIQCSEETDEVGSDSPYFLVFAGSPTNAGATSFGKWGPGYLDGNMDTGETANPGATIATGVSSGWRLFTLMVEEDNGNDLSAFDLQQISNAMFNQYQVSFWKPQAQMNFEMTLNMLLVVAGYLGNDDLVGTGVATASAAGAWVLYTGDGGRYWVNYKLV